MSRRLLATADATCNAILNAVTNTSDDVVVDFAAWGGQDASA